ncbi:MAG: ABC transporter permease [Bacteroidetes bacterium]|nr:ABC transporter permease [Bacteroidota bacterium]
MKMLLSLAWRNIWRNGRRSLLTISAIVFATWLSVVMRGMQLGTYRSNIENAVRMFSSYAQIQRSGYQKNPTLQLSFPYDASILKRVGETPSIEATAPRIYADGLVSLRDISQGAFLIGVDALREAHVTSLEKRLQRGRFPTTGSHEVALGTKLLANLKAEVGDRLVVLAQGADGSLGNEFFTISGILRSGSPQMDATAMVMDLYDAQELLGMEGRIHALAMSLTRLEDIPYVQEQLKSKISEDGLTVLSWKELMPEMDQMIKMDDASGVIFLAILVLIVAFGILNTVLMSVTERFREFGVLLSMGMPSFKLIAVVLLEVCFMTLVGITAGNVLGACVNWYLVQHPIFFGAEFGELYEQFGFLPRLDSTLDPGIFISTTLSIFVVSILSAMYPLVRLHQLEPLKGMRYT